MCNCIKELKDKSLTKLRENHPNDVIGDDVEISNTGIIFSTPIRVASYNELEYKLKRRKKDGTLMKSINKRISLMHNYCPWCGERQNNKA